MWNSTAKSITLIYYEIPRRNKLMLDRYIHLSSSNNIFTDDDIPDIIHTFYMLFGLVVSCHDEAQSEGHEPKVKVV